jgi:hemerythrin-like domain-containing protein
MTMSDTETRAIADKETVLETIQREHRALRQVLELLQHLLGSIAEQHSAPDFELLSVALYYIDEFPTRCHHPKEERYLFEAVRKHVPEHAPLLNRLQAEHLLDTRMLRDLHSALVRYQAGAPDGLQLLRARLDIYVAMLQEHVCKEEELLLEIRHALPAGEWHAIAEGFSADEDPLFGKAQRREFDMLRDRIRSRLPSKLRYAAREPLS